MIRMSTDLPSGARAHLWISDEMRLFAAALTEASLLTEDGAA